MYASSFCSFPLSSPILVIHYLGFLVTSYCLNLENFLHGLLLKAPVGS